MGVDGGELALLQARAAAADQDAPAGAPGATAAATPAGMQGAQLAGEIAGLLRTMSRLVAPMFPRVAEIYSEKTCEEVGSAVAPVCIKRGWLQGGLFSKWGPEIEAAACILPLALATYQAADADLQALQGTPEKKPDAKAGDKASAKIITPASSDWISKAKPPGERQ